jgi:transposase
LCLRLPDQLDEYERETLEDVVADDERIAAGYQLLQRFRRLVVRQCVRDLDAWLEDATASGLDPFMSLARGIQADRAAVDAGLTVHWSTGPVEGHVTRLKLLKRHGYGRASTTLLRRRLVQCCLNQAVGRAPTG